MLLTAEGKSGGYEIKDETKLAALAGEYGIPTEGRSKEEIALDLAKAVYAEFGKQEGFLQFTRRAPEKRVAQWQKMGIDPRGIDREIVEIMHRTHIGVDNDPVNLILQGLKASIADGWGGSMVATEISDVLFGTPDAGAFRGQPRRAQGGPRQHRGPRARAGAFGDDTGRGR